MRAQTRRPRLFSFLAVVATPFTLYAQQPPALTLEECIRKALAVPSSVSLARRDRDIAAAGIVQARSGFLPQAIANLGLTYNSQSKVDASTFSFIALNNFREYIGLATIFQEIDVSGRVRAEYARAKAMQDTTVASLGLAERELRRAIAAAYYRLLLARHLEESFASSLAESRAFERRTSLLADQGEAARADVVKASAQVASLEQALNGAKLAAELASQDLASFWTRDVSDPLQIVDLFDQPLPEPSPPSPDPAPYLRRFEFQFLDSQFRMFQAEKKVAKSALFPHLTTVFQFGLDSERVAWNHRGYAAFVNLNIPLWDWYRTLSAARQMQARTEQSADARAIAERSLSREYQSAVARVRQTYDLVQIARRQMTLSEQDLNLSRIRYEGGEGAAVDVVVAQGQLASARSSYYTTVAGYLNARWDLEVASGR